MKALPRSAVALSIAAFAAAALSSAVTLAWSGSFPAPPGSSGPNQALAEARGWSLVTLALVVPLGAVSLALAHKGRLRGHLVWLGTLAYLFYTYLEIAVSPPFTALYLIYVVAFACAIPALLSGLFALDQRTLPEAFGDRVPRKSIATFALTSAVVLSLAWLKGILEKTFAGAFGWPEGIDSIGHVVHALDLGLQVPLGIATWALLLRRRPAGYAAAAIFLVNSVCMGTALAAMVLWSALAAGRSPIEAAPFTVVPILALALAALFFRSIRPSDGARSPDSERAHPLPRRAHAA